MKPLTFGFNLLFALNLAFVQVQPVQASATRELARTELPARIDGFGIDMSALPVITGDNVESIVQQIAASGARYIRQEINWSVVEISPGVYDWSSALPYDLFFAAASAQGIKIVAVLIGGPVYLAAAGEPISRSAVRERWGFFVRAAVERFGEYVDTWEIGGELNSSYALTPFLAPLSPGMAIGPNPAYYSKLLRLASEVIKDADPNDQVWLGSLSGIFDDHCAMNPLTYLLELNATKSWRDFDAILYTPAQGSAAPERSSSGKVNSTCASNLMSTPVSLSEEVYAVQELARQLGGKPVLVSSLGWDANELSVLGSGRELSASQVEADLLVRASVILMAQNAVPLVFWHSDLLSNPSAQHALANLQAILHNAKPLGRAAGTDDALHEYHFRKGGEYTIIAWHATDGDATSPALLQAGDLSSLTAWMVDAETLTQQTGQAYPIDDNGQVSVPLNERPLIFTGRSGDLLLTIQYTLEDQAELVQIELGKLLKRGLNEAKNAFVSLLEKELDEAKESALEWGEDKLDELLP